MLAVLALGAVESMFNRWIDLDAATRVQLNGIGNKLLRVVIDSPQLSIDVLFDHDYVRISPTVLGMDSQKPSIFEQRPYDPAFTIQPAHTTLRVANLVELGKLLNSQNGGTGNINLQGDFSLLQQLQRILAQASPDLAAQLSPWIGAIPAGQIGDIVQQGKQTVSRLVNSLGAHTAEAVTEDSHLFVARWQMDQFKKSSRELRQDIERVQARLKQLQQTVTQKQAGKPDQQPVGEQSFAQQKNTEPTEQEIDQQQRQAQQQQQQ